MTGWLAPREDEAQRNWAVAVQTYHTALATYRRALASKSRREEQRWRAVLEPPLRIVPPQTRRLPPQLACLTRREHEVADLVSRGCSNQLIADTLILTRGTVANHVAHILNKLGATNRTEIAARMFESATASPARSADCG